MDLRASLIRLAYEDKSLRALLLPVLEKHAKAPPAGHQVPKDVYQRAGRRWLDAIDRKGFAGAVRATEIRISKIKPGSEKAEGIAQYLKAWISDEKEAYAKKLGKWKNERKGKPGKKPVPKYKPADYSAVQKLMQKAEDKAHQITAAWLGLL